ncbi:MAG: hypothetical protein ACTSUE_09035 [Promethearchaeota archaeon]
MRDLGMCGPKEFPFLVVVATIVAGILITVSIRKFFSRNKDEVMEAERQVILFFKNNVLIGKLNEFVRKTQKPELWAPDTNSSPNTPLLNDFINYKVEFVLKFLDAEAQLMADRKDLGAVMQIKHFEAHEIEILRGHHERVTFLRNAWQEGKYVPTISESWWPDASVTVMWIAILFITVFSVVCYTEYEVVLSAMMLLITLLYIVGFKFYTTEHGVGAAVLIVGISITTGLAFSKYFICDGFSISKETAQTKAAFSYLVLVVFFSILFLLFGTGLVRNFCMGCFKREIPEWEFPYIEYAMFAFWVSFLLTVSSSQQWYVPSIIILSLWLIVTTLRTIMFASCCQKHKYVKVELQNSDPITPRVVGVSI